MHSTGVRPYMQNSYNVYCNFIVILDTTDFMQCKINVIHSFTSIRNISLVLFHKCGFFYPLVISNLLLLVFTFIVINIGLIQHGAGHYNDYYFATLLDHIIS